MTSRLYVTFRTNEQSDQTTTLSRATLTLARPHDTCAGSQEEHPLADRHPSAIKRNRQNEKRRDRNRLIVARMRSQVRKVRAAVADSDTEKAQVELRTAIKELSKASTKGVLHKNSASRRIGRLSRAVAALGK